jgi:hypothetical protein
MYAVPAAGEIEEVEEFGNAYGSAPVIWSRIAEVHLKEKYWSAVDGARLWEVVKDESVSVCDRFCLALTFDKMILERKHFEIAAARLKVLGRLEKQRHPDYVNHLSKIADELLKLKDDEKVVGACWNWTSVCADAWTAPTNSDDDDGHFYDISKHSDHWFLGEKYPELVSAVEEGEEQ